MADEVTGHRWSFEVDDGASGYLECPRATELGVGLPSVETYCSVSLHEEGSVWPLELCLVSSMERC